MTSQSINSNRVAPSSLKIKKTRRRQENPRAMRLLQFIASFEIENKMAPNIRECGMICDISSTSVVNYYLDMLVRRGFLTRAKYISRGMKVTDEGFRHLGIVPIKSLIEDVNSSHPEVLQLVKDGKSFVVVDEDKPYYAAVCKIIELNEAQAKKPVKRTSALKAVPA